MSAGTTQDCEQRGSNRVAFGSSSREFADFNFNWLNVADHVSAAARIAFGRLRSAACIRRPGHEGIAAGVGRGAPMMFPQAPAMLTARAEQLRRAPGLALVRADFDFGHL